MKICAVFLLSFALISVSSGGQCYSDNPIHIAVYYESMCPYSREFITKQLYPAYRQIPYNIQIEMVPYGLAKTQIESDGKFTITCQHREKECKANRVHACAVHLFPNSTNVIPFIACTAKSKGVLSRCEKCAKDNKLNWSSIEQCANSDLGEKLHFKNGVKTSNLQPELRGVPCPVINGKYSRENEQKALDNLMNLLCSVANRSLPIDCNNFDVYD